VSWAAPKELHAAALARSDPVLVVDEAYQIAVQVNGKLRGEVQVAASAATRRSRHGRPGPQVQRLIHRERRSQSPFRRLVVTVATVHSR